MLGKLSTKIALHKAGLGGLSNFSAPTFPGSAPANPKSKGKGLETEEATTEWTNPLALVQIPKSLIAWQTPSPAPIALAPTPTISSKAPSCSALPLPYGVQGRGLGRKVILVFLRTCGCPFAEKTFLQLRTLANKHPSLPFIAISHCTKSATEKWITQLGGAWNLTIIHDPTREIYSMWGLGVGNSWHVLNPWTQLNQRKLGNEEGIWARENGEAGSRWVVGGAWGVDELGSVRWGGQMKSADDLPGLEEGVETMVLGRW